MFDWNDLTFFLELGRHGRLMPAARRLKVDHTTVSRRVAELERDLDTKLFHRNTDGFVMTEAGHKLFVIAEEIERNVYSIHDGLCTRPATPLGTVRIASMEGIGAFFLSPRIVEFSESLQGVIVELVTERHLINLTKREADISVSFVPPQGQRLRINRAGEFRLALFASAAYLARKGAPKSRAELEEHDFVDYIEDLVSIGPVHWLREVLSPPHVSFRSTSMTAQQNAVAAGAGIALLPLFSAKTDSALIPVLPNEIIVRRDIYVSVHEDIEYLGRVRAVTRFLMTLFKHDAAYLNEF